MKEDSSQLNSYPKKHFLVEAAQIALAATAILALTLGSLWLLKLLLTWLSAVIWPVAVAAVLSVLLKPLVEALSIYLHIKKVIAIAVLYISLAALWIIGLWLLFPFLFQQLIAFFDYLPKLIDSCSQALAEKVPELSQMIENKYTHLDWQSALKNSPAQTLQSGFFQALEKAGSSLASIFESTVACIVTPIYLFYFLLSRKDPTSGLKQQLSFIKPELREDIVFLVNEFVNILVAFFRGQFLIGMIIAFILSISLSLVGLKFGAVLGLLIGVCNVLPYVGTILGITVALPLAFFQVEGGLPRLGLVLGVFFICHLFEAYILSPKIMGERTGLHPAAIIFSLFFWGTVFSSPLGILLAIPLSAFWVVSWRLIRKKYLPHWAS